MFVNTCGHAKFTFSTQSNECFVSMLLFMYKLLYNSSGFVPSVVLDVMMWINADISRTMDVGLIATRAGYSKWHFQRLFRSTVGCTVARYIRQRRLLVAVRLLRTTTRGMMDICAESGFADRQTFFRVFKSQLGVAPSVFRLVDIEEAISLIRASFGGAVFHKFG